MASSFTDEEKVFDASGCKHFLTAAEFLSDAGSKIKLDPKSIDKIWTSCRSDRRSISRGNFVAKVVPEVALSVYGDAKPESQLKVWQSFSTQLLKPPTQAQSSLPAQQQASGLPSNTAVYTNSFNE